MESQKLVPVGLLEEFGGGFCIVRWEIAVELGGRAPPLAFAPGLAQAQPAPAASHLRRGEGSAATSSAASTPAWPASRCPIEGRVARHRRRRLPRVAAAMLGDAEQGALHAAHLAAALHRAAVGRGRHPVAQHHLDALARRQPRPQLRGVNYYDGQGFMVHASSNVKSAKELNGATICVQPGTTTELNLADYFRANGLSSSRW